MLGISDVVIFGVKSGLKLVNEGRQAFIEETISEELLLPLPNADFNFTLGSANQFYRSPEGQLLLEKHPNLKDFFERRRRLTDEEKETYISEARKFQQLGELQNTQIPEDKVLASGLSANALKSLVTVQQFAHIHNRDSPSAFQRVLGSLIEIGVDTFSKFPGILDTESAAGRAVSGFLNSIDEFDFSSEHVDSLARSLFISVVETIGENTDLLGADEKTELLIKSVSGGLIKDLTQRINDLGDDVVGKAHAEKWGNLVLRSVLGNVGETILANPKSIGVDDPAQQALISSVGTTILGAILDEETVKMRALFSKQGLDQVVKASLHTVADFPELLGVNGEGLGKIITQVSHGLANNEHILSRDMLPETIRLVIEKTAQNAEFLWPKALQDADKSLLATASIEFLIQFSNIPESGTTWRPTFSKTQLTGLLDLVLEETIQNPNWVLEKKDDHTIIGRATRITLNVLQDIPVEQINLETGANILRAVIRAVSQRIDFLDLLERASESKPAIAMALKALVGVVITNEADPKVLWITARGEVVSAILETALDVLARIGITNDTINLIIEVVTNAKERLTQDGRWVLKEVLDEIKNIALKPTI